MPQMAPMSWLILYLMFLTVFLIFIILNYYSFMYEPKTTKITSKKTHLNWKW